MIGARLFNYIQMRKWRTAVEQTPSLSYKLYPAIQMTNACNKQCRACLRSANSDIAKIEAGVFKCYAEDLQRLSELYMIDYQFVTGGEPTIWKSGDMDIVDVLAELINSGIIRNVSMPSNGKVFEDINHAREFFGRLSSKIYGKISVGISIAEYQENLSEKGYIAVDNLISLSREPGMKFIPLILVTLSVNDDTDVRLKKIYPDVYQRVTPLAPLGDASDMIDISPSLSLYGKNKDTLGSFYPYYRKDAVRKLKLTEREFDRTSNAEIINGLSLHAHCGMSPFIDDRWHYCLPFKDDPEFDLCGIGEMREGTISDFILEASILGCIRTDGILNAVDEHKDLLSQAGKERLKSLYSAERRVSIAYRGCMVCKEISDLGILKELKNADCSCKR